ncbi:Thiamine-monophosphate kinase [Anaerobiospirillum thomasii]|uniref:thiamine-phosphate kinase n=1 Tax=Anaerobiospirillum thomasii TaxID=179995 RepID=UPI000D850C21|nr:thiamine-phosphate kinase [Anaerobiospirillum thomasii]SPT71766.1 Thiamine-monophosphate kinase [Anaerobiospirillum thomasii]
MLGEFDLIHRYFTKETDNKSVSLSVGDDCALIDCNERGYLAITTDTLNEGIHYFKGEDPYMLGYKSLLVNVSDLASMGAKPEYFTLSLTLKEAAEDFLKAFADGMFTLADELDMTLIGGNTSKGSADSFSIEAMGYVAKDRAMLRANARDGDLICVTGTLGAPALFVESGYGKIALNDSQRLIAHNKAMLMPNRCAFACELSEFVRCAIDISDGLMGDLKHICDRSNLAACIDVDTLPVDPLIKSVEKTREYGLNLALFGGGDYELLFTVDKKYADDLKALSAKHNVQVSIIGKMIKGTDIVLKDGQSMFNGSGRAFEHF